MSISPDIREWCDEADVDGNACDELRELADRIDREMVELPKDADGEPIHIVDTVYTRDAEEYIVRGIYALADEYSISVAPLGGICSLQMEPEGLTHRTTDSTDSWEKLEEDASVGAQDYCANLLGIDIRKTLTRDDDEAFAKDIIRRAKKLAGIEEGGAE